MARVVKLRDTGELGTSDIAYKADNGKYYSSEKAYKEIEFQINQREECISRIYDILNYPTTFKIPTLFFKKLKEWESMGYDVILDTIISQTDSIMWALNNKSFETELVKVKYISAVIENHLIDSYKKKKRESKQKNTDISYISEDLDICRNKQKTKDISRFLEDED